jgi:prevent-host-death family protein
MASFEAFGSPEYAPRPDSRPEAATNAELELIGPSSRPILIDQLIDHRSSSMDRRVDAHLARTQFGQIIDRATKNNERFIVDRRGEPAVVIMSVQDFIRTAAPPPDWLQKAWTGAKRRGIEALSPAEIDSEIRAHRRERAVRPK